MTLISRWLKSFTVGVFLLSAALAWALPSPKDIESAVQAGHYTQAESMLREVIQEKPQSAKAHYELGQVLAHLQRYKDAQSALLKAKAIDPTLKFATSPEKFNAVLNQVSELANAPATSVVMQPSVTPGTYAATKAVPEPASTATSSLTYVWVAIAALVALGLWLRRSAASNANLAAPSPMGASTPARGFGAQFSPTAQPGYTAAPQGGATMTGAVVGGLAGVAAGYALSKALEGDSHSAAPAAGAAAGSTNGGYVPFETPAQPDLGGFDAGSGSDWDSADSGGSSDDW